MVGMSSRPRLLLLVATLPIVAFSLRAQSCNLLCNSDFEEGSVLSFYPQFVDASLFPCWSTTASDNVIEVWSQPNYESSYAYSGVHFIELNANEAAGLFQDFTATPGATVTISVAHRARWQGQDVMSVDIGHDGTYTTITTVADDSVGWGYHTFSHVLESGGSNTFTLRFTAISTGSGIVTVGNFIDDVSIQVDGTLPQLSLSSTATCAGTAAGTAVADIVDGTGPFAYAWSPSGGTDATAQDLTAGTYSCVITDANGCKDSATVVVDAWSLPVLALTSTAVSCHDSLDGSATASVTDGTAPYAYTWSPSGGTTATPTGLPAGTYTCGVTDAHGCEAAGTIAVGSPSVVSVLASDAVICLGDATTLVAATNGGTPGYVLTWVPDGPDVAPDTTTTYTVFATDAHGCLSALDSATITVPIIPPFSLAADDTSGCVPLCVTFSTGPAAGFSFDWDFGDGASGNGATATHCFDHGGAYDVALTLTEAHGCSNTVQVDDMIDAWSLPIARFSASAYLVTLDEPVVTFTDESIGAEQWAWDFAHGQGTSTEPSPAYRFADAGCVPVVLTVTSVHGCTDADSLEICVKDISDAYVPNSFTPDGDGINDVFTVIYATPVADGYHFTVFDRWGRTLFDTTTPDKGWDGGGVPSGVYIWKLRYRDQEGFGFEDVGSVTLLR